MEEKHARKQIEKDKSLRRKDNQSIRLSSSNWFEKAGKGHTFEQSFVETSSSSSDHHSAR